MDYAKTDENRNNSWFYIDRYYVFAAFLPWQGYIFDVGYHVRHNVLSFCNKAFNRFYIQFRNEQPRASGKNNFKISQAGKKCCKNGTFLNFQTSNI